MSVGADARPRRSAPRVIDASVAGAVMLAAMVAAGCSGSGGTGRTVTPPVPTPTVSPSSVPTGSPTVTPTPTPRPSSSATATPTPSPTASPTPKPTATPTSTPTPTPTPTPSPVPATVFVANQGANSVTGYAVNASGLPIGTPVTTIAGSNTGLTAPGDVALDASGRIYVANQTTITVYPAHPLGTLNEAPVATIDVTSGTSGNCYPGYGIGVDLVGRIYSACPGSFVVYAANPSGTVTTPIAMISTSTGLPIAEVHHFAFDANDRIYVTDNVSGITVFAPNPSGTTAEAPVARIPRDATTTLNYPWGIAVDTTGKITVVDTGRILVFAAVTSGTVDEAPLATITGANTTLDGGNDGLTLDATGRIYEANDLSSSLLLFGANPTGTLNEAPLATVSGSASGINGPRGVAVFKAH